ILAVPRVKRTAVGISPNFLSEHLRLLVKIIGDNNFLRTPGTQIVEGLEHSDRKIAILDRQPQITWSRTPRQMFSCKRRKERSDPFFFIVKIAQGLIQQLAEIFSVMMGHVQPA